MIFLRKTVFFLFVLIYLALCPAAIFYALGYTWDPHHPFRVVKTGLIYLVSAPPAAVRIDGRDLGRTTPSILQNLAPGDHAIELSLEGRKTWREKVPVEAEKATVLHKILLFPLRWTPERQIEGPWDAVYPLGNNEALLLVRDKPELELFYFDPHKSRVFGLEPPLSASGPSRIVSVRTAPRSSRAVLEIRQGNEIRWYGLRPGLEGPELEDWTDLIGEGEAQIDWEEDADTIFVWREGSLTRVVPEHRHAERLPLEGVRGFGLKGKLLYYLDKAGVLRSAGWDGSGSRPLFDDPVLGEFLFGEGKFFLIRFLDKNTALFWDERGELLSNRLPYRFVKEGVEGFEWDAAGRRLLIRQKGLVGVLDLVPRDDPRGFFERGAKLAWIYRGRRIRDARWVYDGSHILVHDDDRLRLIDLETYGRPRLEEIATTRRGAASLWSEKTGKLYFIGPSGGLDAVEVVPPKKFLDLKFPDQKKTKPKGEVQTL